MNAGHRPDIDGLRAVAVLSVVLFHAGSGFVPGGYVGVDAFFVISGYLITGIVQGDIARGCFSLAGFYNRRIRRIFPALAAMLAVTFLAGLATMAPDEASALGAEVAATAAFASNILFWHESGYFDARAEAKPLLHTWSLAVEEQFYLLFPPLLMLAARLRWPAPAVVCVLAAASFAASLAMMALDPTGTFYLLPSRAWELLLGGALAAGAVPVPRQGWTKELLAGAGLAAILAAVFLFDKATPFPGVAALIPCLGAAALLHAGAGGSTRAGWLLSRPPIVFVGLVSYSFYLWHWPALVLMRDGASAPLPVTHAALAVALAFAASVLSWRFVERPIRAMTRLSDRAVIATGIGGTVLVAGLGLAIVWTLADERRIEALYGPQIAAVHRLAEAVAPRDSCVGLLLPALRERGCLVGDASAEPTVALLGDSFADALARPLGEAVKPDGVAVAPYVFYSCPAILGTTRSEALGWAPGFVSSCRDYMREAVRSIAETPGIRIVVFANNYDWYLNRVSERNGLPVLTADDAPQTATPDPAALAARIAATVDALVAAGKTVLFVGMSPSGREAWSAAAVMRRLLRGTLRKDVILPASDCADATRAIGDAAVERHGARFAYVDVAAHFRREGGCAMTEGLMPLTTDGSHLSPVVSQDVARTLRDLIRQAPR